MGSEDSVLLAVARKRGRVGRFDVLFVDTEVAIYRHSVDRFTDLGVLSTIVTWWRVIANSKQRRDVAVAIRDVLEAALLLTAIVRVTPDQFGVLPHDLRKVAPGFEVAHVRIVGAIPGVQVDLVVVEHIGDDTRHVRSWGTGSDVLAIATATLLSVMRVDAALRDGASN